MSGEYNSFGHNMTSLKRQLVKIADATTATPTLQLNEVLGDTQCSGFEYSLRQEQDMVVRVAERVAAAMAKLYTHKGVFAATCHALQLSKGEYICYTTRKTVPAQHSWCCHRNMLQHDTC